MGFRENRSTESALALITEQVLAAFEKKGIAASLLSCDISGAFDCVSPSRLLYSLALKGIPLYLLSFISHFTQERSSTLILPSRTSRLFNLGEGVS